MHLVISGVGTFLEDSAMQIGPKFQVSTRLIDAAANQILTATSDRQPMGHIFEVERRGCFRSL